MNAQLAELISDAKAKGLMLYCSSFDNVPGFTGCCASCHEDEAEGYYPLTEDEIDGVKIYACCSVWIVLREAYPIGFKPTATQSIDL